MTGLERYLLGANVSRETVGRLESFAGLIRKWTPTINLVSKHDVDDLWGRHIADSVQIFPYIPKTANHCLDIGSGGGFPGIVLAVLSLELAPQRRFVLVESDQRKATFLRQAIRVLGLQAEVLSSRAESVEPFGADLMTARALAPLSKLLASGQRHLSATGICLFPKGEAYVAEIEAAKKHFSFAHETIQSLTDPMGVILKIHGIRNV